MTCQAWKFGKAIRPLFTDLEDISVQDYNYFRKWMSPTDSYLRPLFADLEDISVQDYNYFRKWMSPTDSYHVKVE